MNQISVVMGAYNEEATISESIESILSQTYSYWELIIIDDCSTDRTAAVIKRYCDKDHRISIHKNSQNLGLAESLNKGISLAKGPYIARMDADDLSLPNRFEEQVKILDSDPWVMVVGSAAYYVSSHNHTKKLVRMPQHHKELSRRIFKMSPFIHPSVVMRREFLSRTGGYNVKLRRAQDYDLWLRGRFIGKYYNIQEPLVHYTFQNKKMLKGFRNSVLIRFDNAVTVKDNLEASFWSAYEAIFLIYIGFTKFILSGKGTTQNEDRG